MDINPIEVSVVCLAYNQESTIERMINSILNQETTFAYEILIHDDFSTDQTRTIIERYARLYPEKIVPIYQTENQFSKGKKISVDFVYPLVKGKYVAFCEGDDFWICSTKLQQQYEALETHGDCSLCVHDVICVNSESKIINKKFPRINIINDYIKSDDYFKYELVYCPWLFQTTSYFVRSSIIRRICNERPKFFFDYPVGDLPLVLLCLEVGDCIYIKQQMSAYRSLAGGVLTQNKKNLDQEIKYYERMIIGHKEYKKYTAKCNPVYIDYAIASIEVTLYKLKGDYRGIDLEKYSNQIRSQNVKNKAVIAIGRLIPNVTYSLYKKMRKCL